MGRLIIIGRYTCNGVCLLGTLYPVITLMGLYSLDKSNEVIHEPYFTLMEMLAILISLLMVVSLITVHCYSINPVKKFYSLLALSFMLLTACVTSCLHFVILTVGRRMGNRDTEFTSYLFSFNWPSVVYALDILAWDVFFPFAMLAAAFIYTNGKFARATQMFFALSGITSLAGLAGVILDNMHIRNIGIIGYAVFAPVAFFFMGKRLSNPCRLLK